MKASFLMIAAALMFGSCNKVAEAILDPGAASGKFSKYTIKQGQHYSDGSLLKSVDVESMTFIVKFDSSAIYQTVKPSNQADINKLYGFSDNNSDHHQYSARFGWRWSENRLRLFAYVYNEGAVLSKELATINIGEEVRCSIAVSASKYYFTVNGITRELPRLSQTATGKGYQLYPYFGGDETAPHQINIWLRDVK